MSRPFSASRNQHERSPNYLTPAWFAAVSFLSAFLLFSLEPMVAKLILPWFGGSAAVWSTCLVFYQVDLLAGTWYAHWLTRLGSGRKQAYVHVGVLAVSLVFLPLGPGTWWRDQAGAHPAFAILLMLASTVGLPFFLLAATNPLLQYWFGQTNRGEQPYWIYAVSNSASLFGLLSYPVLFEPALPTQTQRIWWSVLFVLFVLLCGTLAWSTTRHLANRNEVTADAGTWISRGRDSLPAFATWRWFALSACGSMLLIATTNHLSANVAAVPLLWVLPLATYLLTFILSFSPRMPYNRSVWLRLVVSALGLMAYAIYDINAVEPLQISLPLFLFGLFAGCLFCHRELVLSSPAESGAITRFYLAIAAGGAAGGIFVGLLCPVLFSGTYDLAFTLVVLAGTVTAITWIDASRQSRLLWVALTAGMVFVLVANVEAFRAGSLTLRRSFYGSLRVVQSPRAGALQTRTLFHGTIEHGSEFLLPPGRSRPITYYGPDSGIGIVLRECVPSPKRVGVVGLGVGTVAAYANTGDEYRFYEINRQDIQIAQSLFFYLRESKAKTNVVEGDGRLSLLREPAHSFDVLALDAFSGDAVPVHLLTEEAFQLYRSRLKKGGVLAFHVSNDFLDLASVVRDVAEASGWHALLVRSHQNEEEGDLPADWVIVTDNGGILENPSLHVHAVPFARARRSNVWTDDYSSLLASLKTLQVK